MKRESLAHEPVFNDPAYAARYAEGHQKMAADFGHKYANKLEQRGFTSGRILDTGCGFGRTDIIIAERFPECELTGIDLSEPLLTLARQSAQEANLDNRVFFENCDVHNIDYPDDSFDVLLNINMVHLVENPIKMLDEIERLLKPGGILYIIDLRRSWLGFFEQEIKSSFTPKEARELIDRTNLRSGKLSSNLVWWRYEG